MASTAADLNEPGLDDPWKDSIGPKSEADDVDGQEVEVRVDFRALDTITPSMTHFVPVSPSNIESPAKIDPNVLAQFDPLSKEETDVWAEAEGRPPPVPHDKDKSEQPPSPPPKTPPPPPPLSPPPLQVPHPVSPAAVASAASNALSSLGSSIARTFSRTPTTSAAPPEGPTVRTDIPTGNANKSDSQLQPHFDFQRFLDQMKSRSAEPVARYLRSFLNNFSKKPASMSDQIRYVHDFLNFISVKMRECDIWKNASDQDFDNAIEAMEKLVMNRLYDLVFTPNVAKNGGPVTTDDLERDHVLTQRIRLFGWVKEEHLDVPAAEGGKGFINFAQQELLKINHYKAPRDKLICILNCCKVIFGLIRHLKSDEGADSFIPILIFVVLKANPEHLLSNVEYINRFRNPTKLQSEAGYYLSSLMGAVSFIETMDHTSLSNISKEAFEQNVEIAIQGLPPSPTLSSKPEPTTARDPATPNKAQVPNSPLPPHAGEESARPLLLGTPSSIAEDTRRFLLRTGDLAHQTISKPLNAIGRIFNEAMDGVDEELNRFEAERKGHWAYPSQIQHFAEEDPATPASQQPLTPYKARVRPQGTPSPTGSWQGHQTPDPSPIRHGTGGQAALPPLYAPRPQVPWHRPPGSAAFLSRQATPGTPQLDFERLQNQIAQVDEAVEAQQTAALETLLQVFPDTDREVAEAVLESSGGDLGRSIETLLEMGSGT